MSDSKWPKVKSVLGFAAAGLPAPELFVLDAPDALAKAAAGEGDASVQRDLDALAFHPIVIRSDVAPESGLSGQLLPRSDILETPQDAWAFISRHASELLQRGLAPDQYCFILHRFIAARAGVFSYARPRESRVRIDAIWGSPDGLLFYPHDSFELDVRDPRDLRRRVRCKEEFLDVDESGRWLRRPAGTGWDWRPSLTDDEVRLIGAMTLRLVRHEGRSLQVMYFVGADPRSGYPTVLPWYSGHEQAPEVVRESPSERSTKPVVIRDMQEVAELRVSSESGKHLRIRLRPIPELLRDQAFLDAVGALALSKGWHISLEGSTLSHAYYSLRRTGAPVRCADPYEVRRKPQRFGKLVRDLIPVLIESHGEVSYVARLTGPELAKLLELKAVEEAMELVNAADASSEMEELADLLEVVLSLVSVYGHTEEDLRHIAERKRAERGAFAQGLVLVETRELPLIRIRRTPQDRLPDSEGNWGDRLVAYVPPPRIGSSGPTMVSGQVHMPLIPPAQPRGSIVVPSASLRLTFEYHPKEIVISLSLETDGPGPPPAEQLPLF